MVDLPITVPSQILPSVAAAVRHGTPDPTPAQRCGPADRSTAAG
jgi:hypothetical protein